MAEKKLWHFLRRYSAEVKFRRQEPIGPFIVDFYAPECRLVVEVDGDVHALPGVEEKDREREDYLISRGLRVARYTNRQVLDATDYVLTHLKEIIEEQMAARRPDPPFKDPPFVPPSHGGRSEG